ncbi:carotenoid oxygenase family protein [Streptomyces sp. NPDC058683]|uniref:carotenoid oxygenase family protein n=1 Tax=Streptomyces sp. NPDC058683 TaxID=3346597 RepID=UPI00364D26EC
MNTVKTTAVPHLTGNYAPVMDELTTHELTVTGAIPPELTGWYLRNGPNPHEANTGHWFLGDGMVHGIRLAGGKATSYRNRWVRTSTFTHSARRVDERGNFDFTAGLANTHVVRHAGRTLALVETSFPYELSSAPGHELDTVGPYDFDGRLRTAMTAHPKTCPITGELHFFGAGAPSDTFLNYHRANADGELVISRPIEGPKPTMMHDFYLTEQHVVFMDLPAVLNLEMAANDDVMPYKWQPEYGARLGVLRRDDPYGAVRWFEIDPCYVFHTVNAHEEADGQRLVLHGVRYAKLTDGVGLAEPSYLCRWTVDLVSGSVREEQLDNRVVEFPRLDDRLAGLAARYGHVSETPNPETSQFTGAVHRYDLRDGTVSSHLFAPGRFPGEAAFAPADDRPGGPGWLMTFVYDAATDRSDLVILDAENLAKPPTAVVHLPRRVPVGFHGSWLPDA